MNCAQEIKVLERVVQRDLPHGDAAAELERVETAFALSGAVADAGHGSECAGIRGASHLRRPRQCRPTLRANE